MQLGGKIPNKHNKFIRHSLARTEVFNEAKEPMRKGLSGYKNNGEEWDFGNLSLLETVIESSAEQEAGTKEANGKKVEQMDVPSDEGTPEPAAKKTEAK
ncbi:MAG: hypothetical protein Q9166_004279 [cf. Caloplaca sp. 2 TL-2023]